MRGHGPVKLWTRGEPFARAAAASGAGKARAVRFTVTRARD